MMLVTWWWQQHDDDDEYEYDDSNDDYDNGWGSVCSSLSVSSHLTDTCQTCVCTARHRHDGQDDYDYQWLRWNCDGNYSYWHMSDVCCLHIAQPFHDGSGAYGQDSYDGMMNYDGNYHFWHLSESVVCTAEHRHDGRDNYDYSWSILIDFWWKLSLLTPVREWVYKLHSPCHDGQDSHNYK